MAEARRAKSKRVEKLGRFTITDIVPGSPRSPASNQAADYGESDGEGSSRPSIDGADDNTAASNTPNVPAVSEAPGTPASSAASSTVTAVPAPNSSIPSGSAETPAAPSPLANTNTVETLSAQANAAIENANANPSSPAYPDPPGRDHRRVKQQGRFTIIELTRRNSEDMMEQQYTTTTSVSITATEVSEEVQGSPGQAPAPHQSTQSQQHKALQTSPRRNSSPATSADKERITARSRDRKTASTTLGRRDNAPPIPMMRSQSMRSVSPDNRRQDSGNVNMAQSIGPTETISSHLPPHPSAPAATMHVSHGQPRDQQSAQQGQSSTPPVHSSAMASRGSEVAYTNMESRPKGVSYGTLQVHLHQNPSNLLTYPDTSGPPPQAYSAAPTAPTARAPPTVQGTTMNGGLASVGNGGKVAPILNGNTMPQPGNSYGSSLDSYHSVAMGAHPQRPLNASVNITMGQYVQQQQTIALLIRQQHDLKQLVDVLRGQQQQLIVASAATPEVKVEPPVQPVDSGREELVKVLQGQIWTLRHANESLRDAMEYTKHMLYTREMEVERLASENMQLLSRYQVAESALQEERRRIAQLEQELSYFRSRNALDLARDTYLPRQPPPVPTYHHHAQYEYNQPVPDSAGPMPSAPPGMPTYSMNRSPREAEETMLHDPGASIRQ